MTGHDQPTDPVDGRVARRQRNIDAVLDVVLEMFGEDSMFPTIEQAATRSGLSLRSLYRYFSDPGELLEATIKRSDQVGLELSRIHAMGQGTLDERIAEFAAARLRLYEGMGPVFRATLANAARHPRIRDERTKNRDRMRAQFELQFTPEISELKPPKRDSVVSAGDLLTQLESIDYLRRHRQLSVADTREVLTTGLKALFGSAAQR